MKNKAAMNSSLILRGRAERGVSKDGGKLRALQLMVRDGASRLLTLRD